MPRSALEPAQSHRSMAPVTIGRTGLTQTAGGRSRKKSVTLEVRLNYSGGTRSSNSPDLQYLRSCRPALPAQAQVEEEREGEGG